MTRTTLPPAVPWKLVSGVVGALALVEITSGVLQGFYTPLLTEIARALGINDADVTWLEAVQLAVSALAVPLLAGAGDRWGHRKVLILATAITAAASWGLLFTGNVGLFFVAWALQGVYAVWLPVEIALVHARARDLGQPGLVTRRAAGILVGALELGVIVGALAGGALGGLLPLPLTLAAPAVVTTLCLLVVIFLVKAPVQGQAGKLADAGGQGLRRDVAGAGLLALSLAAIMGGLSVLRVLGLAAWQPWAFVALGLALLAAFIRVELRAQDPVVDMRVIADRRQWPIQATAFFFGMSVLGAQAPLSTFARTDPAATGHGLGLSSSQTSYIIGAYVLSLAIGALCLSPLTKRLPLRDALILGCALNALGYSLFLPLHSGLAPVVINMVIAGLGSGLLVAALPPAAAAAAPPDRTGMATGATNATKTLGGAVASAVFGVMLSHGGALAGGAAPLSGYLMVWGFCAATALMGVLLLSFVPRRSLQDA